MPAIFFQSLVEREKAVVGALPFLEFDIHIHVAVVARVAPRVRAEDADPPCTKRTQIVEVSLNDR